MYEYTPRSELPLPEINVGDKVRVTNDLIVLPDHKADGVVREVKKVNGEMTNAFISVGVEFDEGNNHTYFFYPFECEVLDG